MQYNNNIHNNFYKDKDAPKGLTRVMLLSSNKFNTMLPLNLPRVSKVYSRSLVYKSINSYKYCPTVVTSVTRQFTSNKNFDQMYADFMKKYLESDCDFKLIQPHLADLSTVYGKGGNKNCDFTFSDKTVKYEIDERASDPFIRKVLLYRAYLHFLNNYYEKFIIRKPKVIQTIQILYGISFVEASGEYIDDHVFLKQMSYFTPEECEIPYMIYLGFDEELYYNGEDKIRLINVSDKCLILKDIGEWYEVEQITGISMTFKHLLDDCRPKFYKKYKFHGES